MWLLQNWMGTFEGVVGPLALEFLSSVRSVSLQTAPPSFWLGFGLLLIVVGVCLSAYCFIYFVSEFPAGSKLVFPVCVASILIITIRSVTLSFVASLLKNGETFLKTIVSIHSTW